MFEIQENGLPPALYAIRIDPPVEVDGQTIAELVLREPTLGEMRKANSALSGESVTVRALEQRNVNLIQIVSGLKPKEVDALPVTIYNDAADYLNAFIGSLRKAT